MTRRRKPLPLPVQRALAAQMARDAAKAEKPATPPPMSCWDAFVEQYRRARRVLDGPPDPAAVYTLELPGLSLPSLNTTTRGAGRIAAQSNALKAARAALMAAPDLPRVAFTRPVRIVVHSRVPVERIDPDNLSRKELLDCLTERGGGLGIIRDDSPRWVRYVGGGYASTTGTACVWVDIREAMPVEDDDAQTD